MEKRKSLDDYDGDGVPNVSDCNMFNPDEQDLRVRTLPVYNPKKERAKKETKFKGLPISSFNFTLDKGYTAAPYDWVLDEKEKKKIIKRKKKKKVKWVISKRRVE